MYNNRNGNKTVQACWLAPIEGAAGRGGAGAAWRRGGGCANVLVGARAQCMLRLSKYACCDACWRSSTHSLEAHPLGHSLHHLLGAVIIAQPDVVAHQQPLHAGDVVEG